MQDGPQATGGVGVRQSKELAAGSANGDGAPVSFIHIHPTGKAQPPVSVRLPPCWARFPFGPAALNRASIRALTAGHDVKDHLGAPNDLLFVRDLIVAEVLAGREMEDHRRLPDGKPAGDGRSARVAARAGS